MRLNREQQDVLTTIIRVGRQEGATRTMMLAAITTGLVESNLRNLNYGDGTSVGWRQETKSSYPGANRLDVAAGARRFFQEARAMLAKNGPQHPGQLAANVQRPREDLRGKYAKRTTEAAQLLDQFGSGAFPTDSPSSGGASAESIFGDDFGEKALYALLFVAVIGGGGLLIILGINRATGNIAGRAIGLAPHARAAKAAKGATAAAGAAA